jgi:hypothetical protein
VALVFEVIDTKRAIQDAAAGSPAAAYAAAYANPHSRAANALRAQYGTELCQASLILYRTTPAPEPDEKREAARLWLDYYPY